MRAKRCRSEGSVRPRLPGALLPLVSAAAFMVAVGWSVASADPLRREIISPSPRDEVRLAAGAVIEPPLRWPPPGRAAVVTPPAKPPPCPARRPSGKLVGVVNINSASEEQLVLLPGVGETKAKRIVRWRRHKGRFRRIIDLRRVPGFGRKTVARLYPYLSIDRPTTLHTEPAGDS